MKWLTRKREPTIYLYRLLYQSFQKSGRNITDWKYYKNNNEMIEKYCNEDEKLIINYLYNYDMLKIKLLLFLIWEFQSTVGLNITDNIQIVKIIATYKLEFDNLMYNIEDEKAKYTQLDNEFLNIECNWLFWQKWYNVCESFFIFDSLIPKSDVISKIYDLNYNKMEYIRLNYNIDRYVDSNIEENEEIMKNWLIILIKDLREEWEHSILLKNNKEGFYWSLLNELEKIGLEKI